MGAVALAALGVALTGCRGAERAAGGPGGDVGGTVVIATAAEPSTLYPPLATGTTQGAAVVDQLFDRLIDLGDSLNTTGNGGFRARLAQRWEWGRPTRSA